jgi:hypothetical protein
VLWYPTQAKSGLEWGTQPSLPVEQVGHPSRNSRRQSTPRDDKLEGGGPPWHGRRGWTEPLRGRITACLGGYVPSSLNLLAALRTRVCPNVEGAVATQAGRPGAGEGTVKAGRQQSARLSFEGRMIGDLALSAGRLRFSE